jgi:prevent-host-death family protein
MAKTGGAPITTTSEHKVYTASEARRKFADLFDEAVSSGKVMVTRRRKTVAMVDAEWLEEIERRLGEKDADEADRARHHIEENGGKELNQFEKEVGLTQE